MTATTYTPREDHVAATRGPPKAAGAAARNLLAGSWLPDPSWSSSRLEAVYGTPRVRARTPAMATPRLRTFGSSRPVDPGRPRLLMDNGAALVTPGARRIPDWSNPTVGGGGFGELSIRLLSNPQAAVTLTVVTAAVVEPASSSSPVATCATAGRPTGLHRGEEPSPALADPPSRFCREAPAPATDS